MTIYYSSDIKGKTVCYFGLADSVTTGLYKLKTKEILATLKIACLLYDHVIITSAYFWASHQMQEVISYIKPLIISGVVLPAIKEYSKTPSIATYFEQRLDDTAATDMSKLPPVLLRTIEQKNDKHIANSLDDFGTKLYLNEISVSQSFRKLLDIDVSPNNKNINSLKNILQRRLDADTYVTKHITFSSFIREHYLSRAELTNFARREINDQILLKEIFQRFNHLYLVANAQTISADLILPQGRISNIKADMITAGSGNITFSNIKLFIRILQRLGVSPNELFSLNPVEILVLRQSQELKEFICFYRELISKISVSENELLDIAWQKVKLQKKIESFKSITQKSISGVFFISPLIFIAALQVAIQMDSKLANAIMTGSATTSFLSSISKNLSWLSHTPIRELLVYITNKKYRDVVLKIVDRV